MSQVESGFGARPRAREAAPAARSQVPQRRRRPRPAGRERRRVDLEALADPRPAVAAVEAQPIRPRPGPRS